MQGDNTVQAITSDGTVAWTASVPMYSGFGANLVPDFQGGLVVLIAGIGGSVTKLDGITGEPYPAYTSSASLLGPIGVHTDGTIFAVQADPGNEAQSGAGTQTSLIGYQSDHGRANI